ncbi:hypothetical protein SCOR_19695 [Sulfidibacter corallicola]|uniref:Tetratricopeptide repeat protein n=1 Tax=Sulfidibacter corallicola TaxID=2818388 RepID=A0A8A4TWI9_SULCO|nr:hypothetical protein [Sulfidibacter corallicola]QTD53332.1 hypothetical protein J3U87_12830 [Sulfidibacter corallicola]
MERALEKNLEKIRKIRTRENAEKAWKAFAELLHEHELEPELELFREGIAIGLQRAAWTETLALFKTGLKTFKLYELCEGDNRPLFTKYVEEYPGFRTALADDLLNRQSLSNIAGWVNLYDEADQRWIIDLWEQAAESILDAPGRAGSLYVASGVGRFTRNELEEGLQLWEKALRLDPRFLKRIMAFCQRSGQLDMGQFTHRLKIIRLILAAGKHNEALSLLLALGNESRDYALKVLVAVDDLFPDPDQADVCLLKFKLAIFLNDEEIFDRVLGRLKSLKEDELFDFKKAAMLQMTEPDSKRRVLLELVDIYIGNQSWESAALLLKSLYAEDSHPDVIALMEEVLERYPILPELHWIVGRSKMDDGDHDLACFHFVAIKDVGEFERELLQLLEDRLVETYHAGYAELLWAMAPTDSQMAGMTALLVVMNMKEKEDPDLLAQLEKRRPKDPPSPFYLLALIHLNMRMERYEAVLPELTLFMETYPELSAELVQPAETLCTKYRADYRDLVKILDRVNTELRPQRAWGALQRHLQDATEQYIRQRSKHQNSLSGVGPEQAAPPVASPEQRQFLEFQGKLSTHLESGNWPAAVALTEKWGGRHPDRLQQAFEIGDRYAESPASMAFWSKAKLSIYLRNGLHAEAIRLGQECINDSRFQGDLPEIYQSLGMAYEGIGHSAEALRFYCLSSRQNRFWQQNRARLGDMVFPGNSHLLKEVLNLALLHEDQSIWDPLLRKWHQHRPSELDMILKAQSTFCEKVGTERSLLDLAFWYLQAGNLDEVNKTLNRIDLRDPEIRDALIHIASLINLKFPEDPKPAFLLGRYYLVHKEVPRAVDTFRNLTSKVPNAAETVYQYLRGYLRKNPDSIDIVHLYGLLIRIALDYGFTVAAVKLLEEFSQKDREGAESLAEGVYRVLLQKKRDNLEALYEFAEMLRRWGAYNRMLIACEQAEFGTHMAQDRLRWLSEAAEDETYRDRALAAQAQIHYDLHDFEACLHCLEQLDDPLIKLKTLDLQEQLTKRFPDLMSFWHDAGWTAARVDAERAAYFFRKIWDHADSTRSMRLEAFAILRESGSGPSLSQLAELYGDNRRDMYTGLRAIYGRLRELELNRWLETEGDGEPVPVPGRALEWLLHTGQQDLFASLLPRLDHAPENLRIWLESKYQLSLGDPLQAALHITESSLSSDLRQSFLHGAGLTARAIALKPPGTRLPHFLRQSYLDRYGKPETINALYSNLKVQVRQRERTAPAETSS